MSPLLILVFILLLIGCAKEANNTEDMRVNKIVTTETNANIDESTITDIFTPLKNTTSPIDEAKKNEILMQYNEQKNRLLLETQQLQQKANALETLQNNNDFKFQEEILNEIIETTQIIINRTRKIQEFIEINQELLKENGYNIEYEKQQATELNEKMISFLNLVREQKPIVIEQNKKSIAYPCPDLSNIKLQGYSPLYQSWVAEVSPYKSGNIETIYSFTLGDKVIFCDVGSSEGQNANWVYCGDALRPITIQYTDNQGIIIKKISAVVTFDKNTKQYLATSCDTYYLI